MGRKYYPAVQLKLQELDYDTAEIIVETIKKSSDFNTGHSESKYERKTRNGEKSVSGYIKLSLETQFSDSKFQALYSADDREFTISYHSNIKSKSAKEFSDIISTFEETIKPVVDQSLVDKASDLSVTTKGV